MTPIQEIISRTSGAKNSVIPYIVESIIEPNRFKNGNAQLDAYAARLSKELTIYPFLNQITDPHIGSQTPVRSRISDGTYTVNHLLRTVALRVFSVNGVETSRSVSVSNLIEEVSLRDYTKSEVLIIAPELTTNLDQALDGVIINPFLPHLNIEDLDISSSFKRNIPQ